MITYCITCRQPMVEVHDLPKKNGNQDRRIYCNSPYCPLSRLGFCNTLRFTLHPSGDLKSKVYSLYFIDSFNPDILFLVDGSIKSNNTSLVKLMHFENHHHFDEDAWESKLILLVPFIPLSTDLENLFVNSQNIYQRLKKLIPFS